MKVDIEQKMTDMQVVVLMGGYGTRLGKLSEEKPKALMDVNGEPFFNYQLKILKRWGFCKFLFLVGFQAGMIERYYGDGSNMGIHIVYSCDGLNALGTGGAVRKAEKLLEDDFMVIYGDSFMDINYMETVYRFYAGKENGMEGLMAVYHNNNEFDKSNVIYKEGKLILYDKKNHSLEMEYIDYGISVLTKKCIMQYEENEIFDLADVLNELSAKGVLQPQIVSKRFYEIGNPASLKEFISYAFRRFNQSNKAVFMDRDGVINDFVWNDDTEQLDSPLCIDEFCFKENAVDALSLIIKKGYLIFIVTNQPAAAKGKVRLERLYDINTWMLNTLQQHGIAIECVEMCPHHPDGSMKTEEKFLIKKCRCRKPDIGLFENIRELYNIDWGNSYMVGDSYTDIMAGQAMGLQTVFLGDYKCDICAKFSYQKPKYIIKNLKELDQYI